MDIQGDCKTTFMALPNLEPGYYPTSPISQGANVSAYTMPSPPLLVIAALLSRGQCFAQVVVP